MNCNFHVGQKVVCIKNSQRVVNDMGLPPFKEGDVFTISNIKISDFNGDLPNPECMLQFAERSHLQWAHYAGFRPVVQRKTDISIFKAMLKTSKALSPQEAR